MAPQRPHEGADRGSELGETRERLVTTLGREPLGSSSRRGRRRARLPGRTGRGACRRFVVSRTPRHGEPLRRRGDGLGRQNRALGLRPRAAGSAGRARPAIVERVPLRRAAALTVVGGEDADRRRGGAEGRGRRIGQRRKGEGFQNKRTDDRRACDGARQCSHVSRDFDHRSRWGWFGSSAERRFGRAVPALSALTEQGRGLTFPPRLLRRLFERLRPSVRSFNRH